VGLTEAGAFHVRRLRLNRTALIEHRRERWLLDAERANHQATLARLTRLEEQLTSLGMQLEVLKSMRSEDLV